MAEKVGSVDLEELKRAREELNAERGIENDPNMYADYNPNRKQEEAEAEARRAEEAKNAENLESENAESLSENAGSAGEAESLGSVPNDSSMESDADASSDESSEAFAGGEVPANSSSEESSPELRNFGSQPASPQERDFSVYENFAAFDILGNEQGSDAENNEITAETDGSSESGQANEANKTSQTSAGTSPSEATSAAYAKPSEVEDLVSDLLAKFEIESSDGEASSEGAESSEASGSEASGKGEASTEASGEGSAAYENNMAQSEENTIDFEKELLEILGGDIGDAAPNGAAESAGDEEIYAGADDDIADILAADSAEGGEPLENSASNAAGSSTTAENAENSYVDFVGNTLPDEVKNDQPAARVTDEDASALNGAPAGGAPSENLEGDQPESISRTEMFAENLAKSEEESSEKIKQVMSKLRGESLRQIVDIDLVDVIDSPEFEALEKLSYPLGRDEDAGVGFAALKDLFNIALFSKVEASVFKFFGSTVLSLMLKNSTDEVNFALLDTKNYGIFEPFKKSSYIFGEVTSSAEGGIELLKKLVAEIDERYEAIASSGAKNIDEYNAALEEVRFVGLPYIVLMVSNLAELLEFDSLGDTHEPLTYILKYGRLVGVYAYIASSDAITLENINFNLSTRVAFRAESEEESNSWIGEAAAEQLEGDDEYIIKTIHEEQVKHYRVPELSTRVAELMVDNIEG